jgi:hypothetical protein
MESKGTQSRRSTKNSPKGIPSLSRTWVDRVGEMVFRSSKGGTSLE